MNGKVGNRVRRMRCNCRRILNSLKSSNVLLFFLGFILAVISNMIVDMAFQYYLGHPDRSYTTKEKIKIQPLSFSSKKYSFSEQNKSVHYEGSDSNRIWFIVSTTYSLSQPPRLVHLAQALFPVRHFVTWIIVQEPNIGNRSLDTQLETLRHFITRFGIHFIVLSTDPHVLNFLKKKDKDDGFLARNTGLNWVLQNVKQGVLMIANEDFTYDYRIFHEIRYRTKSVSVWPVGLGRPLGLSSPVVSAGGVITGYFDGTEPIQYLKGNMNLLIGGYAVNIDFMKRNVDESNLWKLSQKGISSIVSLGFSLLDVRPLADMCTKIYVWRTKTRDHNWPKEIKLEKKYKGTNIETLMKKVYGLRYSEIVHLEK